MRLNIAQPELARAVAHAAKAAGNGGTKALACVMVEARDGGVTFSATDMDTSNAVTLPALVEESGRALVSASKLAQMAKALPDAAVSLECDGKLLQMRCGKTGFELPSLDPDDFPGLPRVEGPQMVMSAADFESIAKRVAPCASDDESRGALMGVMLEWDGMTATATDTYSLASAEYEWCGEGFTAPVPAALFSLAADGDVTLTLGANAVSAECGGTMTAMRLYGGQYPRWQQLMKPCGTAAEAPGPALCRALRRAKIASDVVTVRIADGSLTVFAGGDDGKVVDSFECETFAEMEFMANAKYMLRSIAAIDAPMVRILDSLKPVYFEGGRCRSLVMPMRMEA